MKTKKIILDSNLLIESVKNKIDLFGQIKTAFVDVQIITSKSIIDELEKIAERNDRHALAARIALQLVKINNIKIKKTDSKGDKSLLELCDDSSILITQDRELRKICKIRGFKAGYIRQKKYLMLSSGKIFY